MGGVENPDTSLVRRLKHSSQSRKSKSTKKGKTKARPTKQTTTRKGQKQHKPKKQGGEGASVEKPDTSLARQFKHLNRKQEELKTPNTQKLRYDSTTEAAHKAVRELSAIRGGRNGTREAGSPDSL